MGMVRQIVIEAETPGDSRTMFRLRIDATRVAGDLTAVQAHILVGEILERIAVPKRAEADVATPSPSRLRAGDRRAVRGAARARRRTLPGLRSKLRTRADGDRAAA